MTPAFVSRRGRRAAGHLVKVILRADDANGEIADLLAIGLGLGLQLWSRRATARSPER